MLSKQKITEEQAATFVDESAMTELEIGNSRFGLGIIFAMAAFIGVWGCACLINGIARTQSIHELGRGIFTAFTGI
jgi:hypothetical protein